MNIVVVESPAKAKTISGYLGSNFLVLASYGHVRDLPAKDGSVRPDEDFNMTYQTDTKSKKRLNEIAKAISGSTHLYLATDPDREGEAISWHLLEALEEMKALKSIKVQRVVFNEITKSSVVRAIENPREINMNLVNAQQARRALDYLVGFNISPLLWRKLKGSKSAGRVQSVALKLICEREIDIEKFIPNEYWTIETIFQTDLKKEFTTKLINLDGNKLDKFSIDNEQKALDAASIIKDSAGFTVGNLESKETRRNPPPPFTTSTLQQEASRKLRLSARRTMETAQNLYQGVNVNGNTVGLITYMRTDGVQIANEAIQSCRTVIEKQFGKEYIPEKIRLFKTKDKSAQEAHEAIRPTDLSILPADLKNLGNDEFRIYELIWKRTIASQMENAKIEQAAINIISSNERAILRATGQIILFDGFLKLYRESTDDPTKTDSASIERDEERHLPTLVVGESLKCSSINPLQHFTEPQPRFTEASLVKKLEELGIGRPSTYASIISVLQERSYVRFEKNRFVPEDRGRLVTTFLSNYFERYVEYDFTANLEEQLDKISSGELNWKYVLREFWNPFIETIESIKELSVREVLDLINNVMGPHFFVSKDPNIDPRSCPVCKTGDLAIKLGTFGAFIGCSNYPECKHTRPLEAGTDSSEETGPILLGTEPTSNLDITTRKGPYGFYIQLGEKDSEDRPKRVSIPKSMNPKEMDLPTALSLLSLPREIGLHPENNEVITAGIGRYGPYVYNNKLYASLLSDDDVLSVGLNRAISLLADAKLKKGRSATSLKELGEHPDDNKTITLNDGRYGPYIKYGKINVTLPKGHSIDSITLDEALVLIAAKIAKGPKKSKKKSTTKKKKSKKTKSKKK